MEKHPEFDKLDRALAALHHADIPEGYRASWRAAVQREERQTMKPTPKRRTFWRVALPAAAALVLLVGALSAGNLVPTVTGGGSVPAPNATQQYARSAGTDSAIAYDAAPAAGAVYDESDEVSAYGDTGTYGAEDETQATDSSVKIVRTADLTIASTAFDSDIQALTDLTDQLGGYVASVSVNGEASERKDRVAYYSLRIPSDQLDAFLSGAEGIGRITARSETATDMTTQYSDTQLRLATQQAKMARLQELIAKAENVSDLLDIESEIADTQYEIDQLESSLLTIDRNVDKSDVSVTVQEQSAGATAQAVELTLWQRIASGFQASAAWLARFAQNLLVFVVMTLPVLVPLGAVIVIIWLLVRANRRRKARKYAAKHAAASAAGTPEESEATPNPRNP